MQDYAKLYKKRYSERRSQSMLNQIRRIIYGSLPPLVQLVAIMIVVSARTKR